MKKIFNLFAILLAISLATVSFVSCSSDSDDDDDDSSSAVAVFKATDDEGTQTYSFYADNTYVYHSKCSYTENGTTINEDLDIEAGTYTGDPTKDGSVVVTITKYADWDAPAVAAAIASGKTVTNSEAPLVAASDSEPETITISGGKFTYDHDEYTRQ